MKEQFVTYDIALRLKELGFCEKCICGYNTYKVLKNNISITNSNLDDCILPNKYDYKIPAPIWQEVINFFLEKHKLYITITSQSQESWQWHIQSPHDSLDKLWEGDFESYSEARESGILKAIELCEGKLSK